MATGLFITFEGGEGTGKSTQAVRLLHSLLREGHQAILVHEPGSTPLGDYLRRFLKEERRPLSAQAELFLFEAARAELVSSVVRPNLEQGIHVVADRYTDSTLAYQGHGRRMDLDTIVCLNDVATGGLSPHITFLLDLDPAAGLGRVGSPQLRMSLEEESTPTTGRLEQEGQRGFEKLPIDFHRRVRQGYLALARQQPERWVVLQAARPADELAAQVWQQVSVRLSHRDQAVFPDP